MGFSAAVGLILAVAGGAAAIGISVWFSHDPTCLWGIVLVVWGLYGILIAQRSHNPFLPATLGLILGAGFVGVGVVSYYTRDQTCLWALLLVSWLSNYVTTKETLLSVKIT